MTPQVEQRIYIKFCIKHECKFWCRSTETIQIIQKATAMGNWWLAASSWLHAHSCITSHAEFCGEISNHPGYSDPYLPDLMPCDFWLFPKLKSPLKGKRFQTISAIIAGKYGRAADGDWENYMKSQCVYFEGDWGVIALWSMFLDLVSSSINVSIFHITYLDSKIMPLIWITIW